MLQVVLQHCSGSNTGGATIVSLDVLQVVLPVVLPVLPLIVLQLVLQEWLWKCYMW